MKMLEPKVWLMIVLATDSKNIIRLTNRNVTCIQFWLQVNDSA